MAEPRTQEIVPTIEHIELLLLDGRLGEIEAGLGGFNLFEAIGHTRREERHSDFLAFLLDPNQPHGLGAKFLTRFAMEVVRTTRRASPIALSEIVLADFTGCDVRREHSLGQSGRLDVLCVDETHKFLLAVENKVDLGEGEDQLNKYRRHLEDRYEDFHRVLAYLTPDKDEPSDGNWVEIGYGEVLSIVEALAEEYRESLGDAVVMALDHYARMLRRHIVTDQDSELKRLAAAVYRKHKTALDFIFEQRPDDQLAISELVAELVSEYRCEIEVVRQTKSTINLLPKNWRDIPDFNAARKGAWTEGTHSLLFEILNKPGSVSMLLVVGPTEDEDVRRRIVDFSRDSDLLPGPRTAGGSTHTRIYSKPLIDRSTLERGDAEEIRGALERRFKDFIDEDFDKIVIGMAEAFSPDRAP